MFTEKYNIDDGNMRNCTMGHVSPLVACIVYPHILNFNNMVRLTNGWYQLLLSRIKFQDQNCVRMFANRLLILLGNIRIYDRARFFAIPEVFFCYNSEP